MPTSEDGDSVIRFRPRARHPIHARLDAIKLIIDWSAEMHRADHMPAEVAATFHAYFGEDDPFPA